MFQTTSYVSTKLSQKFGHQNLHRSTTSCPRHSLSAFADSPQIRYKQKSPNRNLVAAKPLHARALDSCHISWITPSRKTVLLMLHISNVWASVCVCVWFSELILMLLFSPLHMHVQVHVSPFISPSYHRIIMSYPLFAIQQTAQPGTAVGPFRAKDLGHL